MIRQWNWTTTLTITTIALALSVAGCSLNREVSQNQGSPTEIPPVNPDGPCSGQGSISITLLSPGTQPVPLNTEVRWEVRAEGCKQFHIELADGRKGKFEHVAYYDVKYDKPNPDA